MGFSYADGGISLPSMWVHLTEPPSTRSPTTYGDRWDIAPSLPHHSWNGAVPLSWCCSLAAISPFCQFPETVSSKSHLRLKTKQQRLHSFLFLCQKLYVYHAKMWHATPCITDTHHSCWLRAGKPSLPCSTLILLWCTRERLQLCGEV